MSTTTRCPQYRLNSTSKYNGDFNTIPAGDNYGSYLYWNGTIWQIDSNKIHLGTDAGKYNQSQGAVALGKFSGTNQQATNAIAIGYNSGTNQQQQSAVAIGQYAGYSNQGINAIAIGKNVGQTDQGANSIAIGENAGYSNQGINAIAIGTNAGYSNQGINAIAIGTNAGQTDQGANSIAIGNNAGQTGQTAGSIILNATGVPLNAGSTGFFVKPIRGAFSSGNVLSYNTENNEIFYNGSSQRYKYDIKPIVNKTDNIYQLQPKEFKYKIDDSTDIGFIAEEVADIDPAFAYLDKDGIPEGIQWNTITTYLVAEIKKIKEDITFFENEIQEIKNKIIK